MSKINTNELMNLEAQWRMQAKRCARESTGLDKQIKTEKSLAAKSLSAGKQQLARMHVVRTLELEAEAEQNEIRQIELKRLVTQVKDFRKTVDQAQAMKQATVGMKKLEGQMDLARLTQITDEYRDKIGTMDMARGIFNDASASSTLTGAKQEDVDRLMGQLADEAGVELRQTLDAAAVEPGPVEPQGKEVSEEVEDGMAERLKKLRAEAEDGAAEPLQKLGEAA